MDNNENKYLVGLDIGTTKIVCIAAQKIENGKLRILGVGKSESKGIVHGEVLNLNLAVKSIQEAVSLCKKSCTNMQLDIHEVYVGIAGSHIKTDETYELLKRENPEEPITEDDLKILEERVNKTDIGVNNQIITVISEGYNIDSQHYVTNDNILGCTGKQIDA
ncbi:MAG: cell division protein FtsA, partial [Alphaproteobacteria bacterium]|nr:cell division protein FtsA [Alphaproteobacteria bacterium]